ALPSRLSDDGRRLSGRPVHGEPRLDGGRVGGERRLSRSGCTQRGRRGARVGVDRVLEAAQAVTERFTHLGQALGTKDHQQDDEQEGYVKRIVETHDLAPLSFSPGVLFTAPARARITRA